MVAGPRLSIADLSVSKTTNSLDPNRWKKTNSLKRKKTKPSLRIQYLTFSPLNRGWKSLLPFWVRFSNGFCWLFNNLSLDWWQIYVVIRIFFICEKIYFSRSSEIKLNPRLRLTLELIKELWFQLEMSSCQPSICLYCQCQHTSATIKQDFTRHVLLTFFYNHILVHETVTTGSRLHKIHYTVLL